MLTERNVCYDPVQYGCGRAGEAFSFGFTEGWPGTEQLSSNQSNRISLVAIFARPARKSERPECLSADGPVRHHAC